MNTRLLFITQKIHNKDDDLSFTILWIKELIKQGADVQVICLEKGSFDDSFPVYSLGREKGYGKMRWLLRFLSLIFTLKYNRVFVHMNPIYVTAGGWFWLLRGIPIYLWYTHYTMHVHLRISGILCKRMFAATAQSLPQYEGNPKKVITGHGIDYEYWLENYKINENRRYQDLLTVHRICRSKRLEIVIKSLKLLGSEYNLSIYGRDIEKDHHKEMVELVKEKSLGLHIKFNGPVPMDELKTIYPKHRLMVNMASETIDKTMLEVMLFGIYPVTTPENSKAIGLPIWPKEETPEAVADFIKAKEWEKYDEDFLRNIVKEKHGMKSIIAKMLNYINTGN